jgi:hypothetical protein
MKYYIKNRKMLRVFLVGWMIILLYGLYLAIATTMNSESYVWIGVIAVGYFLIFWAMSYFVRRVYFDYPMLEVLFDKMIVRTQPRREVVIRYEDVEDFELRSMYMNVNGFVKMKSGVEFPIPLMNLECNPDEVEQLIKKHLKNY